VQISVTNEEPDAVLAPVGDARIRMLFLTVLLEVPPPKKRLFTLFPRCRLIPRAVRNRSKEELALALALPQSACASGTAWCLRGMLNGVPGEAGSEGVGQGSASREKHT